MQYIRDIVTVFKGVIPHSNFEKREDTGFEQVAVCDREIKREDTIRHGSSVFVLSDHFTCKDTGIRCRERELPLARIFCKLLRLGEQSW